MKRYYHFVMKQIKVAAAVIEKDGKILIAKRAYGTQKGRWEFPGGKLEEGESSKEAVIREIKEEFGMKIAVKDFLCTVNHHYEDFDLDMDCFLCEIRKGEPELHDHTAYVFIDPFTEGIEWAEADRKVIEAYRNVLK